MRNTLNTATPVINTACKGTLLLEQSRGGVYFRLVTSLCSISGRLGIRSDWQDDAGRPGVMPILKTVDTGDGEPIDAKMFAAVQDLLQERLTSENLFACSPNGEWELTSLKCRKLSTPNCRTLLSVT